MRQFSFKVPKDKLPTIKSAYASYQIDIKKDGVYFLGSKDKVRIALFTSGMVIIKGDNPLNDYITICAIAEIKDYPAIGTAIAGDLDIFGPLVVTAVALNKNDFEYLKEVGLPAYDDLTVDDIVSLGPLFAQKFDHTTLTMSPLEYNTYVKRENSLNNVKANILNRTLVKVGSNQRQALPVLCTRFCNPSNYFNYLKHVSFIYRDIYFDLNAMELNYSMVVAHIIANYVYLNKLDQLTKEYGIDFARGSSKVVIDQLLDFYSTSTKANVRQVAKLNNKQVSRLNLKL